MNDPAILAQRALRARMASALREGALAAVDLGGAETKCVIARVDLGRLAARGTSRDADEYSALKVAGSGTAPAAGIRNGVVVDPEAAAASIRSAVEAARGEARLPVHGALFSIGGGLPRSFSTGASTSIPAAEVDDATVGRIMAACRPELALRLRRPILVEPTGFTVDGESGIRDPRGRPARSLGIELSILTVERAALQGLMQAAVHAGLGVDGVVFSSVASAVACLTGDEMELGTVCIDMGATATGFAIYRGDSFRRADSVPLGGERITADLAAAMDLPRDEAEAVKVRTGGPVAAVASALGPASGSGGTSTLLVGIVRPRLEEIFEMIRERLDDGEPRPVVLTGGASQMPGVVEVARDVLGRRARLGRSVRVPGGSGRVAGAQYSTALGMLAYAIRCDSSPWVESMENIEFSERRFTGVVDWFRRNW